MFPPGPATATVVATQGVHRDLPRRAPKQRRQGNRKASWDVVLLGVGSQNLLQCSPPSCLFLLRYCSRLYSSSRDESLPRSFLPNKISSSVDPTFRARTSEPTVRMCTETHCVFGAFVRSLVRPFARFASDKCFCPSLKLLLL